jgi:hypothetical protein
LWNEKVEVPVPRVQFGEVRGHRRRVAHGRPALPADLPRRCVEYDLDAQDKAALSDLRRIGQEIRETLEYTPARLEVIVHVRFKYRGRNDAGRVQIRLADAQPSPLHRSNAGAALLAHVHRRLGSYCL